MQRQGENMMRLHVLLEYISLMMIITIIVMINLNESPKEEVKFKIRVLLFVNKDTLPKLLITLFWLLLPPTQLQINFIRNFSFLTYLYHTIPHLCTLRAPNI